jgi:hypothetical protein
MRLWLSVIFIPRAKKDFSDGGRRSWGAFSCSGEIVVRPAAKPLLFPNASMRQVPAVVFA